jgi:hypothetical protein
MSNFGFGCIDHISGNRVIRGEGLDMVSEFASDFLEKPEVQPPPPDSAAQIVERIAPAVTKELQQQDTNKLVDKRILPWLDLFWQDGGGEMSRSTIQRHPELNNPDKLASTLREVLPLADKNHDGATRKELTKFAQSSEGTDTQRAAAQIAADHFRAFSELVRDDWFFQGIKENDMKAFDHQLDYVHLAKKHPELQDPNTFIAVMKGASDRIGLGYLGGMSQSSLIQFIDRGNGSELEKAAAAIVLTNYNTLGDLAPSSRWVDKLDMMLVEAAAKPDLKERLVDTLQFADDSHKRVAAKMLESRQNLVDSGLFKIPPLK